MATKKLVYLNDEMEKIVDDIMKEEDIKFADLFKQSVYAYMVQSGKSVPAPKSVFADFDMSKLDKINQRLDALEAKNGEPKRMKILQDVEDIEKA